MDTTATHGWQQHVVGPLEGRQGEEVHPELVMGLHPHESLTKCDEPRDVLDPIHVKVMKLQPV
jgi:hypothetical protein